MSAGETPAIRVAVAADRPIRPDGELVLYWMTAARRTRASYALDRALEHCAALGRPLLVVEGLRAAYPWASDRLHRFVLDGMRDNAARCAAAGVAYHPYVEPRAGAGRGLIAALAERACAIVTDDFPCGFHPRMVAAAAARVACRLEAVDGNGLVPLRAPPRVFPTARGFRGWLHRDLADHLTHMPAPDPLRRYRHGRAALPAAIAARWPAASEELLAGEPAALAALPIDHTVGVAPLVGGPSAARAALTRWLTDGLPRYADERNQPCGSASSGLSPYLHFGHISPHEILGALAPDGWSPADLEPAAGGRAGFWGMSPAADDFLDELVTWRELGFNFCAGRADYADYDSLPDWAQRTLARHARDPRPRRYAAAELEAAATYDELWNAAQRQLVTDGVIHNYMRMLWGKKILEWSASPREALATMIHLNNKYGLDGRDPSSYSGIFWVLGRYDRAWGPERPIFGTVRYMSSESTARKLKVKPYLARYA